MREVYFEPAGRIHPLFWDVLKLPPDGYTFVTRKGPWERGVDGLMRSPLNLFLLEPLSRRLLPMSLWKAYAEGRFVRPPKGSCLTLAYNHLVFRDEPWIPLVEWVTMLAGFSLHHVRRFRQMILGRLGSPTCRAIITFSEISRQSLLSNLNSPELAEKAHVVPLAVRQKAFVKTYAPKPVRLLFVGSGTVPRNFDFKGGKEVVEAFFLLRQQFPDLELTIRSDVSPSYRRRCQGVPGIRILDRLVPWDELEREFQQADIFVYPSYSSHDVVVLDAMSYELPVVTTAVADRPEVIADGVTGFLVAESRQAPSFQDSFLLPQRQTPLRRHFEEAIQRVDRRVVDDLAARLEILIEQPKLRARMGGAARREVEEGRFSIEKRNGRLKEILDRALDDFRSSARHV